MNALRMSLVTALALGLGACATVDTATRNAPLPADPLISSPARLAVPVAQRFAVTAVNVTVPENLRVSEANAYYPIADIVWRGEPRGDRHTQVAAIFREGMATGTAGLTDGRPVIVDVVVTRFHCLTEKTRYTVGGVHSIRFDLTLRDAATGAIIDGPRKVVADVKASGGYKAIAEDDAGRTQRVVVVERLAQVIARELSAPVIPTQPEVTSRLEGDARLIPAAGAL